MAGAVREDDVPRDVGGDNPQDDLYDVLDGPVTRVLHHFYDPVYNRPLTVGVALGKRAPDWAAGAFDAFVPSPQSDPGRRNHFTIADAKEAIFRALTMKTLDVHGAWVDLALPPDAASKWTMRKAYWGTTFRGLGDVLHLLQDMAQPQHTRNDPHVGAPPVAGHKSVFEAYMDARARGAKSFSIRYDVLTADIGIAATQLPFQICDPGGNCRDYPAPSGFTRYSQFFSTAPGAAVGGQGLADYSNTQFFSAGKNLGNADYVWPPNSIAAYTLTTVAPTRWDGSPIAPSASVGPVYLYSRGVVIDNQNLAFNAVDVPLTSVSLWDEFMQRRSALPGFHLTRQNYDAQAKQLLPRAVAYGVGLLQRFFRGSLQIDLPEEGAFAIADNGAPICKDTCGFGRIRLKLKNTTSSGETLGSGTYFAVAKFRRNNCYVPDLSGDPGAPSFIGYGCRSESEEIVVSDALFHWKLPNGSLAAGEQQPLDFSFSSPIPINATDIYLQVVFRGQLGNEADAVVVTTKNISEPNYLAVVNDSDYLYNGATDTFQPNAATQTMTQVDVKLGGATMPIATLGQIAPKGYAQLAFLTDLGAQHVVVDYNMAGIGSPSTTDLPVATFDSPGGTVYQRTREVTPYRGMWSDYRLDFFAGYQYAIAPCGAGDLRNICTSAGLTTIPVSNAVPWTINFP